MKNLVSVVLICLGFLATSAHANTPVAKLYVGAGFTDGSVEVSNNDDRSLGTLSGVVGLQFSDFLGVELSAGAGSDQSDSILSDPLVNYQAVMLRVGYRWDRTAVYLLAGQARLDVDSDLNITDAGNAFGFGINLFGNETTALNFNFLDIDDGAFSTATIGFTYFFGGFR